MRLRAISATAAAIACHACAARAEELCTAMELRRGRPFIAITLNGVAAEALLDSGAEATIIDADYARKAGLESGEATAAYGSGGTAAAHELPAVTVAVAGRALPTIHPYAIDLSDVSARLFKARVDVVLGREIFDAERVRLDYPGGRLCFVGRERDPAGRRLDLEEAGGLASIPIEIEGGPVRADLDTGNSGALLLGSSFVEARGFLTDGRKVGVNRGGGLGGEIVRKRFITITTTIAGETFNGAPAVVDPPPRASPANVGSGLLKYFRVTLDYKDKAAWFERAAPPRP